MTNVNCSFSQPFTFKFHILAQTNTVGVFEAFWWLNKSQYGVLSLVMFLCCLLILLVTWSIWLENIAVLSLEHSSFRFLFFFLNMDFVHGTAALIKRRYNRPLTVFDTHEDVRHVGHGHGEVPPRLWAQLSLQARPDWTERPQHHRHRRHWRRWAQTFVPHVFC